MCGCHLKLCDCVNAGYHTVWHFTTVGSLFASTLENNAPNCRISFKNPTLIFWGNLLPEINHPSTPSTFPEMDNSWQRACRLSPKIQKTTLTFYKFKWLTWLPHDTHILNTFSVIALDLLWQHILFKEVFYRTLSHRQSTRLQRRDQAVNVTMWCSNVK